MFQPSSQREKAQSFKGVLKIISQSEMSTMKHINPGICYFQMLNENKLLSTIKRKISSKTKWPQSCYQIISTECKDE